MNSKKTDVLVIGGGVIGMSLAYELSSRGAQVTVIDKGEPGFGCSYGNAGWITPCFAMPLPMPGMFIKAIGWLLDPESPLYIKPAADPVLFRWLTHFMLAMNNTLMQQSIASLVDVSKYSLDSYKALAEQFPEVRFEQKGLLMVGQSQDGVDAAVEEMELVAKHGVPGKYMTAEEVKKFEPSLTGKIQGGVYFPEEAHAEPLQIVKALAEGARRNGATIISGCEVFDYIVEAGAKGNRIAGIRTTRGTLTADEYVLSTGSWSTRIGKQLKLSIPILGGKGYAIIAPPLETQPKVPMMLVEKKIAVTPRDGSIRIAGTLELVNMDEGITPRRVDAIVKGARQFMTLPQNLEIKELWRGLRPCTPDGVPLIGRPARYSNLTLNTGHQMLGLQSAPGCARLAADIVLGAKPAFDPHPFRADRF